MRNTMRQNEQILFCCIELSIQRVSQNVLTDKL